MSRKPKPVDPIEQRKKAITKNANIIKNGQDEIIKTENYRGKPRKHNKRAIKKINHIASCYGSGSGQHDTISSLPTFYDPYFEPSSLVLPRDTREINSWCRYFYKYDPLVATAIDAHSELPLSKIRLQPPKSNEKERSDMILTFFEDMIGNDGIDLFNKLLQIGVEYYKLGNVFPYLQMNDEGTQWEKLILLDPDFISVQKLPMTDHMIIELIPNDQLRSIVSRGYSPNETNMIYLYESIPPEIREMIRLNKTIPLSTDSNRSHVSHLARKMSDYDLFGTSLIERNFKALVYKDRLRQSQDAIAARHLTPKHLIWASDTNNVDAEVIREQVDNAFNDPDYAIITNFELHWELIGTSNGLMQLSSEWEWINEELMIGLMINKSFLLGEGAFANGQTVLEVLEQRYSIFRETLEQWIEQHVFKPIARANGFTEKRRAFIKNSETGKIEIQNVDILLYPHIKWNRLNLTDDNAHKQMLSQMVERGFLDAETWLSYFGLDADIINEKIEKYKDTPLDSNYQELQRNIQSEIGRIIGPAIAKQKAEEMGLALETEEEGGGGSAWGFSNKMNKFAEIKDMPGTSQNIFMLLVNSITDEIMKKIGDNKVTAETREDREKERELQRKRHRQQNIQDKLEPREKPKILPPRVDLHKTPDLFADVNEDDIIVKKNRKLDMGDSLEYSPEIIEM